ncbi:vWA domain-containing protein [Desulfospira joergensenii]|uniref:vWA domain-containing protein n=1 Tax=Desulfospira joergensenii TaxID=53329 RepID=UPI0003B7859D|nr:VWA domain-containing protein [Desulfospira joergensenii]
MSRSIFEKSRAWKVFTGLIAWSMVSAASLFAAPALPDKVVCRVETEKSVLEAGRAQKLVLKVSLDAPSSLEQNTRPPVNLGLVLDRSGSMGGTKMEKARAAAIEALKRLGREDVFSLVVYDSNVQTIVPAQKARNVQNIIQTIRQIQPGGNTALFGGVSQGAAEIRKSLGRGYVHRMILLSDGLANVGPKMPSDLGRLGAGLVKENISVSTVGVGTDYNEDLMAQLAQKSDGNTYFVESSLDLPRIFAQELGDVLNVVAKQVRVVVTLEDGVEPIEIIGREGRIRGNQVEIYMNQLYGSQQKYALIEVNLPPSPAGSKRKLARAEVRYENPVSHKEEMTEGISWASFSSDSEKVARSANVEVVREYQLNLNALAQEKAIELSDKGKTREAAEYLKKSATKLKEIGGMYQDEELLQEAEEIQDQAEAIESRGMDKKSRKLLRTKSYQMKNQQVSQ